MDQETGRPDLTERPGNPAFDFKQKYTELMQITDPELFRKAAIDIITARRGHGISELNYRKFMNVINRSVSLRDMQYYVTNFMLSAMGLSVVKDDIEVMASMITSEIGVISQLTEEQQSFRKLVEQYGFKIGLLGKTI